MDDDPAYFRAREREERDAAANASCMVRDVHLELADEYHARADALAREQAPADQGGAPPTRVE